MVTSIKRVNNTDIIFMGHGINKDSEEIPYVQLLDPSPPPRVKSSFTKLRGYHV